jgi:hypothetical protein
MTEKANTQCLLLYSEAVPLKQVDYLLDLTII